MQICLLCVSDTLKRQEAELPGFDLSCPTCKSRELLDLYSFSRPGGRLVSHSPAACALAVRSICPESESLKCPFCPFELPWARAAEYVRHVLDSGEDECARKQSFCFECRESVVDGDVEAHFREVCPRGVICCVVCAKAFEGEDRVARSRACARSDRVSDDPALTAEAVASLVSALQSEGSLSERVTLATERLRRVVEGDDQA
jgi:hypothetical protein